METPFGQLATLDLSDHELCRRIISLDKQSLAEGLVVESVFDQYLAAFPRDQGNETVMVDADTAIAANPGDSKQFAFVWDRVSGQGLGRYLKALDHRHIVWLVRFSEPDRCFYAASCKEGKEFQSGNFLTQLHTGFQAEPHRMIPASITVFGMRTGLIKVFGAISRHIMAMRLDTGLPCRDFS